MHMTQGQKAQRAAEKKQRKKGKNGSRKFGRKTRNGKPFGMHGGCGCITCRSRGKKMC